MGKSVWRVALAAIGFGLLGAATAPVAAEPALIPWPVEVSGGSGAFTVTPRVRLCTVGDAASAAEALQTLVKQTRGLTLAAGPCDHARPRGAIVLALDKAAAVDHAEGYSLDIGQSGVRIAARDSAGLFYGAMTLAQLISADDRFGQPAKLSGVHIRDYPRFAWRGLMIDSARHFLPVPAIETMLDQMAQHKLNVMHWHLTDDQGWRLEIKRYPELTQIGAWRTPPTGGGPAPKQPYGGFYSQDQVRAVVAYAAARHITIVPEIDMPGHAQAAVAAHPEISVPGDQPKVAVNWGVNPYLYNTDAPSLEFIRNVMDEVMALFPSTYIHVGGDEAVKDQWKASAKIQAQIKALGLKDEEQLQSWFIEQVGVYLAAHGRRLMGWDEILEGGVPPSASVMSWRGTQGAIDAAKLGHDVVLSPAPTLYFDNLQSRRDDEPAGRLAVTPLSQVYAFETMPSTLSAEEAHHVLGAQANLWSEYLMSPWYVEHAAFPRLDALAEAVWTPQARRSWSGFLARLPAQMARYHRGGIPVSDAAFAVDFDLEAGRNAALAAGAGQLTLSNQTGFGVIRYTTDGQAPGPQSPIYRSPVPVMFGQTVQAATYTEDGALLAAARRYDFTKQALQTRNSNGLEACPGGDLGLRVPLTPDSPATAPVFDVNIFDTCWIYPKAQLSGAKTVRIEVGRLARNYGLAHDQVKVISRPAKSPFGELEVHVDRCDGPVIARFDLADPSTAANRLTFAGPVAPTGGVHDLCLLFTAPIQGPFYALDQITVSGD